jgi:hypothetical protein
MTKNFLRLFAGGFAVMIFFAATVPAQQNWRNDVRDQYIISAKAGGVNFVEGSATVEKKDGRSLRLVKGDKLSDGDRVVTGANSRAEILLNPGSYARVGSDTSFEIKNTSLDDLELKVNKGSVVFEVFASKDFEVTIRTPKSKMALIQSGIYRVDVMPDGMARIIVNKGRAQLYDNAATLLKSGRQALLNGPLAEVAKFDSDDKDTLDVWSKERAKEAARISRKVDMKNMRNALLGSYASRGWNMYGSFGLWTFDAAYGGYGFLPFGYGWNSPYGYGFGPCIGNYHLPPVIYGGGGSGPGNGGGTGTGGNGGNGGSTPIAQNPRTRGGNPPLGGGGAGDSSGASPGPRGFGPPPFVLMQNDTKSGASDMGGIRPIIDSNGTPVYVPTAPPAPSMPSPSSSDSAPVSVPMSPRGDSVKIRDN